VPAKHLALVCAGVPCHTWTSMEAVNRAREHQCNFRTRSGRPTTHDAAKRAEAVDQGFLAENTVCAAKRAPERDAGVASGRLDRGLGP
jgi:hypothetical protein